ncbi:hypothetical protein Tco_1328298 [Tanacetum coccineum]
MAAGQRKLEVQWLADERNVANLDQRLKSLIISVLPDDQMNSVINCLTTKSTWDDLILYHEDFQDSHDDKEDVRSSQDYMNDLEEEYKARALLAKSKRFFKKVPSYQSPFQTKLLHLSEHKPELKHTKDFEAKYNKVKAKLALLSSSASTPSSFSSKNKGLIVKSYDWDKEEVSPDDEETEVKALMALITKKEFLLAKKVPETVNGLCWDS